MAERKAPLSGAAAGEYLREWMDLHAVSSWLRTKEHLICVAISNHDDVRREYRVEKMPDSEGQCNVHVRPLNSDEEWQWVDAITVVTE